MDKPLMPLATAVWLIDNTSLTFEQIAEFCGLHNLQVQGIADGEVAKSITGVDPIVAKQLTREEISRCEANPKASLQLSEEAKSLIKEQKKKQKTSKYTPIARRQDKPDAIDWLLKNCPELTDQQIVKLIGTTKKTIDSIRDRSHANYANLKPRDPVMLGLCKQSDLDRVHEIAKERVQAAEQASKKAAAEKVEKMS
jgi:hypothetical protein